jgi:hypothetical protein
MHVKIFGEKLGIWIDEHPSDSVAYHSEFDVLTLQSQRSNFIRANRKTIICEIKLFSAITSYALLGFDYTHLPSEEFLTCKIPKPFRGKIIEENVADTIYHGLESDFSEAIRDELSVSGRTLPPGELKVSHILTSEVGSSQSLFKKLVRILMFLLSTDHIEKWSKEEFEEKIGEIFYEGLIRK